MTSPYDTLSIRTIDDHMIVMMRLLLVLAASLVTVLTLPPGQYGLLFTALVLYIGYCFLVYLLLLLGSKEFSRIRHLEHWVDSVWCTLFMAAGATTSAVFFLFFLFAILTASFRWGYREGLRTTLVSAILYTVVNLNPVLDSTAEDGLRYFFHVSALLVIGYMLARWGGFNVTLMRRLVLLKEVTSFANPRFGVDHTINSMLERIRNFYDVESCLLVTYNEETDKYEIRSSDHRRPGKATCTTDVSPALANLLLALPSNHAVIYNSHDRDWWHYGASYQEYDLVEERRSTEGREATERLAAALDTNAFITVPLFHRGDATGRLFLMTQHTPSFEDSDVGFLLQTLEHVAPVIDNIRLVDQLALGAAEEERRRIARDLHDSVIQPYIGLQLGLAAIHHRLVVNGSHEVAQEVEHLIELTNTEVCDLRNYMHGLKHSGQHENRLLAAVQRFARKFSRTTGIKVDVETQGDITVHKRLAAEAFHMVVEGLSNVRRHTKARRARVSLSHCDGHLVLRIENDCPDTGTTPLDFTPRSITERALSLGGYAQITSATNNNTAVTVEIPL